MTVDPMTVDEPAHPKCHGAIGHVCQELSGRACIEQGCNEPAGTWWGPLWCPDHDQERLDRIDRSFADIKDMFDDRRAL